MATVKAKNAFRLAICGSLAIHIAIAVKAWSTLAAGYPDFTIFYSAGKLVREGMGDKLYDQVALWQAQHESAPILPRDRAIPYMHPPFEALIFVPLTFLSLTSAYLVWNGINLVLLVCIACLIRSQLSALGSESLWWVILALLAFFPIFNTFLQGQDVIVLVLLYAAVFVAVRKGAWLQAGCWLGLGSFRIHLIAPFLILMLLRKKWRLAAGFLITAVSLAFLSLLVAGWHEFFLYPVNAWKLENHLVAYILPPQDSPNLRGLVEAFVPSSARAITPVLVGLLSLAAILLIFHYCRQFGDDASLLELQFGLVLTATILLSYHTMLYDYSLYALTGMLVWNYVRANSRMETFRRWGLLLPLLLLWFTPFYVVLWALQWRGSNLMAVIPTAWALLLMREISHNRAAERVSSACVAPGDQWKQT